MTWSWKNMASLPTARDAMRLGTWMRRPMSLMGVETVTPWFMSSTASSLSVRDSISTWHASARHVARRLRWCSGTSSCGMSAWTAASMSSGRKHRLRPKRWQSCETRFLSRTSSVDMGMSRSISASVRRMSMAHRRAATRFTKLSGDSSSAFVICWRTPVDSSAYRSTAAGSGMTTPLESRRPRRSRICRSRSRRGRCLMAGSPKVGCMTWRMSMM
mmetsp:Transcript_38404/g.118679  ORF Transcript_38404/g.118679 Transcript_38404/m.118679 type:complete len:216 (-) Transcript_38404:378-1025(-)